MGLDTSLHLIYGYKTNGKTITNELETAWKNKEISDSEYDDIYEDLTNNFEYGKLYWCDDTMCGDYEYIGLSLLYKYDDYGEDIHHELNIKELEAQCDDELLDKLIQEQAWLKNIYDPAGLFNGELPKLFFIKKVW